MMTFNLTCSFADEFSDDAHSASPQKVYRAVLLKSADIPSWADEGERTELLMESVLRHRSPRRNVRK